MGYTWLLKLKLLTYGREGGGTLTEFAVRAVPGSGIEQRQVNQSIFVYGLELRQCVPDGGMADLVGALVPSSQEDRSRELGIAHLKTSERNEVWRQLVGEEH